MSQPLVKAACLTPAGRGAIATVLVHGPAAAELVDRIFVPAANVLLAQQPIGRIVFGHWAGEELIVCRTGDDRVEIHCHGGSAAVDAVLRSLEAQGATIETWQEQTTQIAGDLLEAEAWQALARARTQRAALVLLEQFQGALGREIASVRAAASQGQIAVALAGIDALLERTHLGLHLVEPFRVVLTGRPNVGKSSLVNRLLGYSRAIISPTAGTTRDVLSAATAFDGWPAELFDTAGMHETPDELEAQGIRRAGAEVSRADLIVCVHDATADAHGPSELAAAIANTEPLNVWNKADLVPAAVRGERPGRYVSAVSGEGIDELAADIARRLVPLAPQAGSGVPFLERHVQALKQARQLLALGNAADAEVWLQRLVPGVHDLQKNDVTRRGA